MCLILEQHACGHSTEHRNTKCVHTQNVERRQSSLSKLARFIGIKQRHHCNKARDRHSTTDCESCKSQKRSEQRGQQARQEELRQRLLMGDDMDDYQAEIQLYNIRCQFACSRCRAERRVVLAKERRANSGLCCARGIEEWEAINGPIQPSQNRLDNRDRVAAIMGPRKVQNTQSGLHQEAFNHGSIGRMKPAYQEAGIDREIWENQMLQTAHGRLPPKPTKRLPKAPPDTSKPLPPVPSNTSTTYSSLAIPGVGVGVNYLVPSGPAFSTRRISVPQRLDRLLTEPTQSSGSREDTDSDSEGTAGAEALRLANEQDAREASENQQQRNSGLFPNPNRSRQQQTQPRDFIQTRGPLQQIEDRARNPGPRTAKGQESRQAAESSASTLIASRSKPKGSSSRSTQVDSQSRPRPQVSSTPQMGRSQVAGSRLTTEPTRGRTAAQPASTTNRQTSTRRAPLNQIPETGVPIQQPTPLRPRVRHAVLTSARTSPPLERTQSPSISPPSPNRGQLRHNSSIVSRSDSHWERRAAGPSHGTASTQTSRVTAQGSRNVARSQSSRVPAATGTRILRGVASRLDAQVDETERVWRNTTARGPRR